MENGITMIDSIKCSDSCHKIEVPSDDEVKALKAMKNIKQRVREIKKVLDEKQNNNLLQGVESELNRELAYLKKEWQEWEEKRAEAARMRMVILGHEQDL